MQPNAPAWGMVVAPSHPGGRPTTPTASRPSGSHCCCAFRTSASCLPTGPRQPCPPHDRARRLPHPRGERRPRTSGDDPGASPLRPPGRQPDRRHGRRAHRLARGTGRRRLTDRARALLLPERGSRCGATWAACCCSGGDAPRTRLRGLTGLRHRVLGSEWDRAAPPPDWRDLQRYVHAPRHHAPAASTGGRCLVGARSPIQTAWRRPTRPAASWSAICTTAPNSASWQSCTRCSGRRVLPANAATLRRPRHSTRPWPSAGALSPFSGRQQAPRSR